MNCWPGNVDRGIGALEKAYREHEGFLTAIKVHPQLDALHGDPRFAAIQKQMRLE
jgi:hypothetical protein